MYLHNVVEVMESQTWHSENQTHFARMSWETMIGKWWNVDFKANLDSTYHILLEFTTTTIAPSKKLHWQFMYFWSWKWQSLVSSWSVNLLKVYITIEINQFKVRYIYTHLFS